MDGGKEGRREVRKERRRRREGERKRDGMESRGSCAFYVAPGPGITLALLIIHSLVSRQEMKLAGHGIWRLDTEAIRVNMYSAVYSIVPSLPACPALYTAYLLCTQDEGTEALKSTEHSVRRTPYWVPEGKKGQE